MAPPLHILTLLLRGVLFLSSANGISGIRLLYEAKAIYSLLHFNDAIDHRRSG